LAVNLGVVGISIQFFQNPLGIKENSPTKSRKTREIQNPGFDLGDSTKKVGGSTKSPGRSTKKPGRSHSDPGRSHSDPGRSHSDPERSHSNPGRSHSDPDAPGYL